MSEREKHFLEKGDTYMYQWISAFGSEEESNKQIMKILKAIMDLKKRGNIITKLVGSVSYYNPNDDETSKEYSMISSNEKRAMLIGFLEGCAVNQNLAAKPIGSEDNFNTFKIKLGRLIHDWLGALVFPTDTFIDLTYEDINNIFKNHNINYHIGKTPEEIYYVWKG